jgi:hypothetical protein
MLRRLGFLAVCGVIITAAVPAVGPGRKPDFAGRRPHHSRYGPARCGRQGNGTIPSLLQSSVARARD